MRSCSFLVGWDGGVCLQVCDDPLNQSSGSEWARHFKDQELFDEIEKDVLRTHPDLQFFLDPALGPARYQAMLRVLFLYAKLNPGVRYVQGGKEETDTIIQPASQPRATG